MAHSCTSRSHPFPQFILTTTLVFRGTVNRGKKRSLLPATLEAHDILQILHNHAFLGRYIWGSESGSYAVRTVDTTKTSTTVVVKSATLEFKATFTNTDDGVSVGEEGHVGFDFLVRWTILPLGDSDGNDMQPISGTEKRAQFARLVLEEDVSASCFKPLKRFCSFADRLNPKTIQLIALLEKVATGEISREEIEFAGLEHSRTDYKKCKDE